MKVKNFSVEYINRKAVKSFVEKYHYSHNINGIQSYHHFGLYSEGNFGLPKMIGAMMYAMPSMPDTAAKYNPINPRKCMELRRLVCVDDTPKNTESYFIGKTLRWLKRNTDLEVIISFADQHYEHSGTIYKASNFEYFGETSKSRILMVDGKEVHGRSLNQTKRPYGRELKKRYEAGDENIYWVPRKPKHIFVYYLNKKIKRKIKKLDLYK
tara:strand:- start:4101 stop:4733 length:633 start_codon:yes stop_codon:yes gene_type:complete